jgi:hypothetical protein
MLREKIFKIPNQDTCPFCLWSIHLIVGEDQCIQVIFPFTQQWALNCQPGLSPQGPQLLRQTENNHREMWWWQLRGQNRVHRRGTYVRQILRETSQWRPCMTIWMSWPDEVSREMGIESQRNCKGQTWNVCGGSCRSPVLPQQRARVWTGRACSRWRWRGRLG